MRELLEGWEPGIGCVRLEPLRAGITIPEYSVTVPWLVSRRELFQYVPQNLFLTGSTQEGEWPSLRFTCLGVTATFAFNFVSHWENKLTAIEMLVDDTPIQTTAIGLPTALLESIGQPKPGDTHCFHWFGRSNYVECTVAVARRQPHEPKIYSYSRLIIVHHEGATFRWKGIVINEFGGFLIAEIRRCGGRTLRFHELPDVDGSWEIQRDESGFLIHLSYVDFDLIDYFLSRILGKPTVAEPPDAKGNSLRRYDSNVSGIQVELIGKTWDAIIIAVVPSS